VFSTLHTNDAVGAMTRLQDIGVEPYLVSSSVLCIIGQRLVRMICESCKQPAPFNPEWAKEFGLASNGAAAKVWEGKGCDACKHTGYRGRTVIYEILPISSSIQALISVLRSPATKIREKAIEEGMRPLRQCGWEKVAQGITTPAEVLRVTLQGL
jgi:general secretion pathway protein E